MGLKDIISGRNLRSNRITGVVATKPLEMLNTTMPVRGFLSDYAHALAYATDGLVKSLIDEKDGCVPEYREIGKAPDKHVRQIERLSSFCASWLHRRFLAAHQEIFRNEDGQMDDTGISMAADTDRVLVAMYDVSDAAVERALALSDELDAYSDAPATKIAEDHNILFCSLLGIERTPVPIEPSTVKYHEAAFRNFLAISAALISHQDMVATLLDAFSKHSKT